MHALSPAAKAQWQIHFCVLLWGFTAILGKLITLDALPLVWWRMLLVVAVLAFVPRVWRGLREMPRRLIAAYAGIGVLVGLHWLTFYAAIKLANASVGATCIALATPFTALLEPWLARRPFSRHELALGLAVLPGVALVAGGLDSSMRLGLLVGTVSAFLVAVFGSLNKRLIEHGDAFTVTGIELGSGAAALTVLAPVLAFVHPALGGNPFVLPGLNDGLWLIGLALVCTLLPFSLYLLALRHMSAFASQLATNLEPVYAIVLAAILLGEQKELTLTFYLGAAVIIGVVLVHPLVSRPRRITQPELMATSEAKSVAE